MIRMENVTKRYDGTAAASVDDFSLVVEEGSTVALIGPSGCGKTTTMRMINRLIDPTSGKIFVNGQDTKFVDPVELRRHIGYVIQSVGLFPHLTIGENIAAVPRLLGWAQKKIDSRVEEMLDLVGLDANEMLKRYPRQLSGGQRQRIGVARALAADPPVLLMDEPFGAIDPIARERLQKEFRAILKRVRKTVVLVTHDLDEAIRLGDRIVLMRSGKIVQHDTPNVILSQPADGFVASFVGVDRAIKRLGLFTVRDAMSEAIGTTQDPEPLWINPDISLRDALAIMVERNCDTLTIGSDNHLLGRISREAIFSV